MRLIGPTVKAGEPYESGPALPLLAEHLPIEIESAQLFGAAESAYLCGWKTDHEPTLGHRNHC